MMYFQFIFKWLSNHQRDPPLTKPIPPSRPILECCQAPYRWRHARLTAVRDYLRDTVANGNYVPILTTGLDWIWALEIKSSPNKWHFKAQCRDVAIEYHILDHIVCPMQIHIAYCALHPVASQFPLVHCERELIQSGHGSAWSAWQRTWLIWYIYY